MTRSTARSESADVEARLRSYEAARHNLAVAEEVLEWMTWRAIEGLGQNRIYNPRDIAARLGMSQRDVIRRMVSDENSSYGKDLSPDARNAVAEVLHQSGDVDRQ